ncbi:MAG: iron chelate uptake ABC transporter family permease subunit [Lachnospiraceae bacterium]|nr:iron chelate uptake ABC transporter family permease subunit [Lachnospiraceae bacterium]
MEINAAALKEKRRMLWILGALVLLSIVFYMTIDVNLSNSKFLAFSMKLRTPKMVAMVVAAFAIGAASIVFQSVINNTIVTPCLLGMNSLYTLIHTVIYFFFGAASIFVVNAKASFLLDLVMMVVTATIIYGVLFKKTNYNILYILLIGTVLSSLFGSMQEAMIRVMDPNDYDNLLLTLVAGFDNINGEIIVLCIVLLLLVAFFLRKDIALLDVITLGKHQAINLGVDYDKCIRRMLIGVTIYIAIATAMVGPVSFLGLILSNLSRQLLKSYRHTYLILGASMIGMLSLVAGQILVEHVFTYAIPVSIFITLGGGIYFLFLLLSAKKG